MPSHLSKEECLDTDPSASSYLIILLVICYLFSALFSIIKTVFTSVDRSSIPPNAERQRYYASKIEHVLEHKSFLGILTSFGRTFANSAFAIIAFLLAQRLYPAFGAIEHAIMAFGLSVAVLTLFAYTVPRAIAMRFYMSFAPMVFTAYSFFNAVFYVFTAALSGTSNLLLRVLKYDERLAFLSPEDKSRMDERNDDEEGLDENEREMIRSIFELGETTVKEIMVPRIDIKALDTTTDLPTVIQTIKNAGHSRIPVYRTSIDTIVGILYAKELISWISEHEESEWDLEALIKKPYFVPVSKKIDDLMAEMKKTHIHMVVVVDEYGGTAGIVTMEDILEEIVGEIHDEYDVGEEQVVEVAPNIYKVDPHVDLEDLGTTIDIPLEVDEDAEYNTLGGLIYHEHGDVPKEDTELEYEGMKIRVLQMDGQRIESVQVEVVHDREQEEEEKNRNGNGNGTNGK